jgi:spore coat protein A
MNGKTIIIIFTLLFVLSSSQTFAATTTINPSMDNTLAEELPNNSSGDCDSIFAGMTDNNVARRALLQFDIATAIPAGSTINSVTLTMSVTRGSNHPDIIMTLHPVTLAWAEAASGVTPNGCGTRGGGQGEPAVNGAATWLSAMHNQTLWSSPGGDFGAASGSTLVNNITPVWNSSTNPSMVSDVQNWLDNPAANYGWLLKGPETASTTARRFDSTEGAAPPALVVNFTPSGDVEACCETNGDCSLTIVGSGNCTGTTLPGVDSCEPNQCPQPTGACCNVDETCSDSLDRLVCESAGGTFQGENSTCSQGNVDCGLTPFVEPLPIPPVLQPTGTRPDGVPQYTVSVEPAIQSVHPALPATDLWTYNGAWPAATIVATQGQPIEVTYQNNLPAGGGGNRGNNLLEVDTCAHGPNYYGNSKRIVTHLHGGHLPARVDGQPEFTILPGEIDIYEYPNNQEAGTVWYHDHALGITRLNVYGGMAGFYLIADSEDTLGPDNAFGLPSGEYEIGLAIQDRTFNTDGSLFYNAQLEDAFKGDKIVVNGKVWPFLNVKQGKYRFRLLNGSQSREYIYRLENITDPGNDPSFILVGTDLGLVSAPIDLGNTIGPVSPAERMDVVIDFSGFPTGTEIIFRNDEQALPLLPNIMKFIVTNQIGYTGTISSTLRNVAPLDTIGVPVRYFRLSKESVPCSNDPGRTVNEWHVESLDGPGGNTTGKKWDDLNDFPVLGTREIWEFENPTNSMHPMHVHLVRFQVVSKETIGGQTILLDPWETNTWKDTVRVPANSRVRIIMDFEDYLGRYAQHCHILDHEDHEMMRQFQTTNNPAYAVVDGVCSELEDCISNPTDCAERSGALCGNGLCEAGDGENCITCPADCAGKQSGAASKQFCCGDEFAGNPTNPIGCGVDISDNRCINASSNTFCRVAERVRACCGDRLCEGQETEGNCPVDCAPPPPCTPTEPTDVTCDGIDGDCDGSVDEDYIITATSCGQGVCASTGQLECQGGTQVDSCTPGPQNEPADTTCDGIDGDCDGSVDEDYIITATSCGQGVCASTGQLECQGGTQVDSCTPGPQNEPADTTCDGLDGDCDGTVDEDYIVTGTSCGVGACESTGQLECQAGSEVDTCTPGLPSAETCNNVDDNCDASTDEGCDDDGDGYCDDAMTVQGAPVAICPSSADGTGDDCDDLDLNIYPGGPAIRKVGTPHTYYSLFQVSYNNTVPSGTLQIQDHEFTEVLLLDDATTVIFQAGYDCGYSNNTGVSIVTGGITIDNGAVTLESGTLEIR